MTRDNYPRLAIVTGADSGIGQAVAKLLATEGFDVGITFHTDEDGVGATAREIEKRGQRVFVERFDAAAPDAGDVVDVLAARLGGLGVLVNVAGTGHATKALDLDLDTWRHVLATDLDCPFLCAQRAARLKVGADQGGRIVNVTSVHEHGITVNAVAPGEIATEMTGMDESEAFQHERPLNPLGRPGHVADVASVIGFLASPRAGYVTGSSYAVDGGLMLMAAHGHDSAREWREV